MGIYLNPDNSGYKELINSQIMVDKSLMIKDVSKLLNTKQKCICISRPRRFGKSTDVDMLVAYYSKNCNSHELFDNLNIAKTDTYEEHLNKHNVIHIDMQEFLSLSNNASD